MELFFFFLAVLLISVFRIPNKPPSEKPPAKVTKIWKSIKVGDDEELEHLLELKRLVTESSATRIAANIENIVVPVSNVVQPSFEEDLGGSDWLLNTSC